jgi:hypothetical protein
MRISPRERAQRPAVAERAVVRLDPRCSRFRGFGLHGHLRALGPPRASARVTSRSG